MEKDTKNTVDSIDDKLDHLQRYMMEQLEIARATAYSQAIVIEHQNRILQSHDTIHGLVSTMKFDVGTLLKTTNQILGITQRTEAIVRSYRTKSLATTCALILFDPWIILYAYLIFHPVFPHTMETFVSAWQFALLAYRVPMAIQDLQLAAGSMTSLSGILSVYLTNPYKAIYILYWMNRQFVLNGYTKTLSPFSEKGWSPGPEYVCGAGQLRYVLVCNADYIVQWILYCALLIWSYCFNSGLITHVRLILDFERGVFGSLLSSIQKAILHCICSMIPFKVGPCRV
jgi:hypothetical protein